MQATFLTKFSTVRPRAEAKIVVPACRPFLSTAERPEVLVETVAHLPRVRSSSGVDRLTSVGW